MIRHVPMSSHEFARHLLALPDIPIVTPPVKEYEEGDEDGVGMETPCADVWDSEDADGLPVKAVLISYRRE